MAAAGGRCNAPSGTSRFDSREALGPITTAKRPRYWREALH
jgi:hypothetical protein